jgi:hypothetical protein
VPTFSRCRIVGDHPVGAREKAQHRRPDLASHRFPGGRTNQDRVVVTRPGPMRATPMAQIEPATRVAVSTSMAAVIAGLARDAGAGTH